MPPSSLRTLLFAALTLTLLPACAPLPGKPDPRDPWERVNRATYKFNDVLDRAVAKPVAKAYRRVTPQFAQTGVANFFSNLDGPTVIINDGLQGKPKDTLRHLGRFVVNSTLGLGGLLDPASRLGLDAGSADFGQTFGHWGIHPGPYVVLPVLGPSDVRDGIGLVPETSPTPSTT